MKRTSKSTPVTLWSQGTPSQRYTFQDDVLIDGGNHYRLDNGSWSGGGRLYVRHRRFTAQLVHLDWWYNTKPYTHTPYVGTLTTVPTALLTPSEINADHTVQAANTWAYGATGWKRARPGNPVAGVANVVGELREGLPRIPLALHRRLRDLIQGKASWRRLHGSNAGDEYLNGVFGWAPLLGDLRKMYELYSNLDKRLAQIIRENGKGVHKRRLIKNTETRDVSTSEGGYAFHGWGNPPANLTPGYGKVNTVVTHIEKVWFVGRFRYYIPDIGSSQWKRRTIRALYGANITPEVAWNLLPWSWLADWFGNMGDVMSNMSSNAVDNLTADYAFVMRTVSDKTEYFGTAWWNSRFGGDFVKIPAGSTSAYAVNETTYKLRTAASPYGFGATFDGLSNYQMGVLAALGISRARFS